MKFSLLTVGASIISVLGLIGFFLITVIAGIAGHDEPGPPQNPKDYAGLTAISQYLLYTIVFVFISPFVSVAGALIIRRRLAEGLWITVGALLCLVPTGIVFTFGFLGTFSAGLGLVAVVYLSVISTFIAVLIHSFIRQRQGPEAHRSNISNAKWAIIVLVGATAIAVLTAFAFLQATPGSILVPVQVPSMFSNLTADRSIVMTPQNATLESLAYDQGYIGSLTVKIYSDHEVKIENDTNTAEFKNWTPFTYDQIHKDPVLESLMKQVYDIRDNDGGNCTNYCSNARNSKNVYINQYDLNQLTSALGKSNFGSTGPTYADPYGEYYADFNYDKHYYSIDIHLRQMKF